MPFVARKRAAFKRRFASAKLVRKTSSARRAKTSATRALTSKRTMFNKLGVNTITGGLKRANLNPYPLQMPFKLTYVEDRHTFDCGIVGVGGTEVQWRLNSIFDPYYPAGGHQPYYRDQLAATYQTYRVTDVEVEVKILQQSTNFSVLGICLTAAADPFTLTTLAWNIAAEKPQVVMLGNATTTGSYPTWRSGKINIAALEGLTKAEFADRDGYSADMAANPALGPLLRIAAYDMAAQNTSPISATISLIYHGYCYNRLIIGSS